MNRWLGSVFGEQAVPEFEVSARTMELLDQLVQISEARCEEVRLLIDDHRQKASEYSSDGKKDWGLVLSGSVARLQV